MRLKLTFNRSSSSSDDIVVTTDAAASISEVAVAIRTLDPQRPAHGADPDELTLAARLPGHEADMLLPSQAPIGESWLGHGAAVKVVDPRRHYEQDLAHRPPVAVLRVLDGPDAGREFTLNRGTTILGRQPDCDVVLSDPLISKRHVRFEAGYGVEVIDLGSANGVVVDGGIVPRVRVFDVETLLIGDTHVEVTVISTDAAVSAPQAGPVPFNRSPRVEERYLGNEFAAPEVPAPKDDAPFPWLAMLSPFLLGVAMFVFTNNPLMLMFCLLSPVMLIGNFATTKTRDKRRLKRAIARFEERLASLAAQLEAEHVREHEVRLREAPSTAEAAEAVSARTPLLWTRRPEHWSFLNVRLGTGTMSSRNVVQASTRGEMLQEFQERLDAVIEQHRTVDGVPIIDNLYDAGALGLAGPSDRVLASLNAVMMQLTALHSPAEVAVAALVTPRWSAPLSWLKWLPHSSSPQSPISGVHLADSASSAAEVLNRLEELITVRLAEKTRKDRRGAVRQSQAALERGGNVGRGESAGGTASPVPAVVVIISDDVDVDRARLVQVAERAADAGVYPVWLADHESALPAVCRTYLALGSESGHDMVGFVRLGDTVSNLEVEQAPTEQADGFAKRLAPVIDSAALIDDASDLPRSVSLVTLLGHETAETSEAVVDRWRQNSSIHDRESAEPSKPRRVGTLRAVIGSAGVDAMHLDLRTQGPHALVGGTTGSGKSEFLQAWVLGMAAEYSPDRVTFLFVDYKGGSAFADCVSLPHCVGLVTDLSPHLVRRALTSLRAELHYREHLLNRKKAKDLLELEKRGDPESPPALVLVIDEFAALVGEVPEFVDGVVDIAQRGRSLGIHLIMATQRPAGVIKDNLRANTNLRIALRMADEADSHDVIGVDEAAHFDPSIPGRGVAKTGPGRLTLFQSGYAGGWTSREPERADIEVAELRFGGEVVWSPPDTGIVEEEPDLGPTDQQRLVAAMDEAQHVAHIPDPRRPWLDELAPAYDLSRLRQRTDLELLLGVADIPENQTQQPVYFEPDSDGHLAVFGASGSGKSGLLRTLAAAAAITPRGGPVRVYGLDFAAGALRMLEQLPHVGSIVLGDDVERVVRLMRTLKEELERRSELYTSAHAASISDYRTQTGSADEPRILLLVDGFANFREDFELSVGRAEWFDVFKDILSDGRALGIHVVLTADRPGAVPSAISSNIQRRVVLRLADDSYGALDVPGDVLSASSPPGRAIVDQHEAQIAILGGDPSVSAQSAATERLGQAMTRAGVLPTEPIGSLPKEYPHSDLPESIDGQPVLGISDIDLAGYPFAASGTMLLAGPPASGRTTALASIARSLVRADADVELYYFGNSRSVLTREVPWTQAATSPEEIGQLGSELLEKVRDEEWPGRLAIVIESLGDFLQTPADMAIVDLVRAIRRSDHFIVAEAETSSWGSSWPLFGEFKNGRRGLILQPDAVEGDMLLKTPLPRMNRSEFPVGRGMYIAKGKHVRIQMPLADGDAE